MDGRTFTLLLGWFQLFFPLENDTLEKSGVALVSHEKFAEPREVVVIL